jgi:two-component system, chemotaxis family, sensor kinase CheA
MSHELSPEQRKELLDDFYAECDEQLGAVRSLLAELSTHKPGEAALPTTLEALFRNLHSIKGNSTIVGLRVAEELAHAAEDYLRALTRSTAKLSEAGLDILHQTSNRLEQIVGAHRTNQVLPAIDDLLVRLREIIASSPPANAAPPIAAPAPATPPSPPAGASVSATEKMSAARGRGLHVWQCSFAPTKELDARGVNVAAVRARLSEAGEIISAAPNVRGKGSMSFDFVVAFTASPDPATWGQDGVVLSPLHAPSSPPSPPKEASESRGPADQASTLFVAPSHIVRVDLGRLDDLMRIAGELVIHRSRLEARINEQRGDQSGLKEVNLSLSRSLKELRAAITRIRLVPLSEIFARMPFVVRDLSRESGKKVNLVTEGQHTEVDKYLVERLKEPLLHLVRNAFSHGIESPAERAAAAKPTEGTIHLAARPSGDSVLIEIRDDGRGVDATRVVDRAKSMGLAVPDRITDATVLRLLCTPGFSTRDEADRASGRGVGMSVVYETLRELGGQLTMDSTPGKGTLFTLRLPLTLSILDTLIISVGPHICAIAQGSVSELLQLDSSVVRTIGATEIIPYRDGVLPITRLHSMFGVTKPSSPTLSVVVVASERGSTGLVVDKIHSQREVVLRPMKDPLIAVPGISGATELGDGRPVLILDPITITNGAVRPLNPAESARSA